MKHPEAAFATILVPDNDICRASVTPQIPELKVVGSLLGLLVGSAYGPGPWGENILCVWDWRTGTCLQVSYITIQEQHQ